MGHPLGPTVYKKVFELGGFLLEEIQHNVGPHNLMGKIGIYLTNSETSQ